MTHYDWECYLNEDQIYTFNIFTATTTGVMVAKYNPMRRRIILPANPTTGIIYEFGDVYGGDYSLWAPTQSNSLVLTWNDLGDLITFPVWAAVNAGTQTLLRIIEVSVNPTRWAQYRRYRDAQLAQLGAL